MEKFKDVEKRIATAYANLYAVASLSDDEILLDVANTSVSELDDTDALLGFWHGIGMTPDKAFEYCEILEINVDLTEVRQIFAELDTLV